MIDAYVEANALVLHLRAGGQVEEAAVKKAMQPFKDIKVSGMNRSTRPAL